MTDGLFVPSIEAEVKLRAYRFLWLKYITGFKYQRHCDAGFSGSYSKLHDTPRGRLVNAGRFSVELSQKPFRYLYLCGVTSRYEDNLHVAFQPEHGSSITFEDDRIRVVVSNAAQLSISPIADGFGGFGREFTTCRNWQFGMQYLGGFDALARDRPDLFTQPNRTTCVMIDSPAPQEPVPVFVASPAAFKMALKKVKDTTDGKLLDNFLEMLRFQARAVGQSVTATELAKSVGYDSYRPANRQYGELGKRIADALNFTPPKRMDGSFRYWTALSTGDATQEDDEHFRFVMRPELLAALTEMRWVQPS